MCLNIYVETMKLFIAVLWEYYNGIVQVFQADFKIVQEMW